jgi:hypothetical protein
MTREPNLLSPERVTLKPDLLVKNREGVFMVDVAICHEDGGYLQTGRRSKIEKYAPLLSDFHQRYSMEKGEVLLTVIGTRGALLKQTVRSSQQIA